VHAAIVFRPSRALSPLGTSMPLSPRQRNREAVAQAQGRIERRKDARHLVATNPSLARDLRIGRPDLPREYDDGGLVDVNHVPAGVLAAPLGLSPAEVSDVLAARDKLGRFASADELGAYTSLPPDRVDELRDLMIFG
jgi:DNA uptake protein ComE-like DNA-binding protein